MTSVVDLVTFALPARAIETITAVTRLCRANACFSFDSCLPDSVSATVADCPARSERLTRRVRRGLRTPLIPS